ncbi:hypothetical protein G7048_27335 (plasmid) [Diaphorobacter sp. HDW4B]|uniref:hypothetical protein n=1 Tax=Diaphorobacter sp. HDW4B TaxID=2714925 RepID=UPI0014073CB2|nr:hypothetical protein [Diaphorobacter sp. HDW4B]QIL74192.1 hypothetical protein G7048_27335 [Diaphorobacter sp. HDW4B]
MTSFDLHQPVLESQFKSRQPETEFPHFGRDALDRNHAVFSIIEHLNALHLNDWAPHLLGWLSHYDGLELYAEDDPHVCVRQVLFHLRVRIRSRQELPSQQIKEMIVDRILDSNFVYYRAHWGIDLVADENSRVWRPLEQSWFNFLQEGDPHAPLEALHIWMTDKHPKPTMTELRGHLLGAATSR